MILAATFPDALTFSVSAVTIVLAAIGVVTSRNPVHCALYLVAALFGIAVLFVEEQAEFLAAVQVIVYAGAIVILFLFVIMLLGVDRPEEVAKERLFAQRPVAGALVLISLGEVLALVHANWSTGATSVSGSPGGEMTNVSHLAKAVFTTYLLPFEATSILLVIAVVGAVVLARRHRERQPGPPDSSGGGGEALGPPPAFERALDEAQNEVPEREEAEVRS